VRNYPGNFAEVIPTLHSFSHTSFEPNFLNSQSLPSSSVCKFRATLGGDCPIELTAMIRMEYLLRGSKSWRLCWIVWPVWRLVVDACCMPLAMSGITFSLRPLGCWNSSGAVAIASGDCLD